MGSVCKFLLAAVIGLGVGCGSGVGASPTANVSVPTAVVLQNTAVPFATADPLTTRVEQNGVVLTVTLPRATFWASEIVHTQARLENEGNQTFAFGDPRFLFTPTVLDGRGDTIVENPSRGVAPFGGGPHSSVDILLKPGDVLTQTVEFQVPATPNLTAYEFWVTVRLNEPSPFKNTLSRKLALKLGAGPMALPALEPDAEHQLHLHMHVTKDGYQLTTADGLGNPIKTPVSGILQIATGRGVATGGMQFDATGQAKSVWQKGTAYGMGSRVEVWVWADGYAVNSLAFRTPGDVISQPDWIAPADDRRKQFDTIRAAQAQFDLKLYTLGYRPEGLVLDSVLGHTSEENGGLSFEVDAYYRLSDGSGMKFTQTGFKQDDRYISSELVGAYDDEAAAIQVGTQTGYVKEWLGRWQLEWAHDGLNFRLIAPRAAMTQAELVNIAAKIVALP